MKTCRLRVGTVSSLNGAAAVQAALPINRRPRSAWPRSAASHPCAGRLIECRLADGKREQVCRQRPAPDAAEPPFIVAQGAPGEIHFRQDPGRIGRQCCFDGLYLDRRSEAPGFQGFRRTFQSYAYVEKSTTYKRQSRRTLFVGVICRLRLKSSTQEVQRVPP